MLGLVRDGKSNAEIAVTLGLSVNTVRYHVSSLLSKADVASRSELRDWLPAEEESRPANLFAPLAHLVGGIGALAGLATVVAAGVAAAVIIASLSDGSRQSGSPPAANEATVDVPDFAEGRVPAVETVALVFWGGDPSLIQLLDARTGEFVASAEAGYRPQVTFRRSARQLLVTHRPTGRADASEVLDVLDITDGLALTRRIETPNRPTPKVGSPGGWMTISKDERFYAYSEVTVRRELPECQGNSYDGPSCARTVINILDLTAPDAPPYEHELPRHCGAGLFRPSGPSGISVTCADGATYVFESSAHVGTAPAPVSRFPDDPVISRNRAQAAFAVVSDDGWFGSLLSNGTLAWTRAGSPETSYSAVPDGMAPRDPMYAEIGGGRLAVGYVSRYYVQYPEGLGIVNMSTGHLERTLPGYNLSRTLIASGPSAILGLTQDGRLIEIDLNSGSERTLSTVTSDGEAVELVR